ncbi:hypothetical protein JCM21531_328 [Acetivibrio straminisolvens JCM 21531]|uniref:Uncharacterized protein n=1 Tax=Acetivibrio straminisolvens JCM 21531 TaxID=1294263 RepID=W4V1A2_9FIRM|nr:hypothetical protein JCM21531_328 [Acetivibrio straminisolvens JCM 21531]
MKTVIVIGKVNDSKIDFSRFQKTDDSGSCRADHMDLDFGMQGVKQLKVFDQIVPAQRVADPKPDFPAVQVFHIIDLFLRCRQEMKDLIHILIQNASLKGQFDPLRCPDKQRASQLFFQLPDGAADGRLRDIHLLGGLCNAFTFCDVIEGFIQLQIHVKPYLSS